MVFQTSDDLNPVFASFGELVDLSLFPSTSPSTPNAAVVIYRHRHDAETARDTLHGQVYSDREVSNTSSCMSTPESDYRPLLAAFQIRVTLIDVSGAAVEPVASTAYLDPVHADARPEEPARPSPRVQHIKAATAPFSPLSASTTQRPMAFDPFSPLSSPKPTRQAHPTHIQLPKMASFTPPPHSFVDTLTPRGHYTSTSFRLRPGVTSGSETETVATEVSSPETYVEEANDSSPEGSIGKWFVRRRSDASIKISAPGDSYVEKTGRARDFGGDKTGRVRGRTGVDDLQKRVQDLAVDESASTLVSGDSGLG